MSDTGFQTAYNITCDDKNCRESRVIPLKFTETDIDILYISWNIYAWSISLPYIFYILLTRLWVSWLSAADEIFLLHKSSYDAVDILWDWPETFTRPAVSSFNNKKINGYFQCFQSCIMKQTDSQYHEVVLKYW